jgi:hypothetical protein
MENTGTSSIKNSEIKKTTSVLSATEENSEKNTKVQIVLPSWNSIHILGLGETTVVGNIFNGSIANNEIEGLKDFVIYLKSLLVDGTSVDINDMHIINIINNSHVAFIPRSSKSESQEFSWDILNNNQIDNITLEIIGKAHDKFLNRQNVES